METIFELKLPKDKWFIFWDVALSSFFVFAFTFSLTFFGPFLLGARSQSRHKDDLAINIIGYFLKHPDVSVTISFISVFIYLFYKNTKNKKINYIYKAEKNNQKLKLFLSNRYFNKFKEVEIQLDNLRIDFSLKSNELGSVNKQMLFFNKTTEHIEGIIFPNHFLWEKKILVFKKVVSNLAPFINSKVKKHIKNNMGQRIFER